jgi:hypothetical protein
MNIRYEENPRTGCWHKPWANGREVRVGREKKAADPLTCTPPRKIRRRFRGCKHTSLAFLVGKASGIRSSRLYNQSS